MPTSSVESTATFTSPDGPRIFVRRWMPAAGRPKAAVQIAHGAAEHSARYGRFAAFLNAAGYAVYADDHRGHGETAGNLERAGVTGHDGWNGIGRDLHQLAALIRSECPGVPFFFLGHSMGSLLGQGVIERWGDELSGAILMGSTGAMTGLDELIAMIEPLAEAAPNEVCVPFAGAFAAFNERFGPGGTGYEWLSRDAEEVRKYVDDPWCGFPFSNRFVADMLRGLRENWRPENEARIPRDLPVLVISGADDPVGGPDMASLEALVERYRGLGIEDLEFKLYPGTRHEPLNETNRDEIQRDLLAWLDKR